MGRANTPSKEIRKLHRVTTRRPAAEPLGSRAARKTEARTGSGTSRGRPWIVGPHGGGCQITGPRDPARPRTRSSPFNRPADRRTGAVYHAIHPGPARRPARARPRGPAALRPAPAVRKPDLADLLGRSPVNLDTPELQRFLAGKRVLVTGAGGSIGSEICRQTMRFCPRRVVLVERTENALFEIDRELRERWVGADIRPCLADVCDAGRVAEVFAAGAAASRLPLRRP